LPDVCASNAAHARRAPGTDPEATRKDEIVTAGLNVTAARCEALFVSSLQRSDEPTMTEVRDAIRRTIRELGSRGCACCVAQEFGDHPETAVPRMRWARAAVAEAFLPVVSV
jgi:hypothetical protein